MQVIKTQQQSAMLYRIGQYSLMRHEFNETYSLRRRSSFFILWANDEDIYHIVENQKIIIPKNHLLFISPDCCHSFVEDLSCDFYVILFDYNFYARTPKDAHFLQNYPYFFDSTKLSIIGPPKAACDFVNLQINLMEELWHNPAGPISLDITHNIIQGLLLSTVYYKNDSQNKEIPYINVEDRRYCVKFRELLQLNYAQHKTVDFYAYELNITSRRLNYAIKRIYGCSAKQLITDKLYEEAKNLLSCSDQSLKEISFLLGFSEENNFSAFFTKHAGLNPKKYRKIILYEPA